MKASGAASCLHPLLNCGRLCGMLFPLWGHFSQMANYQWLVCVSFASFHWEDLPALSYGTKAVQVNRFDFQPSWASRSPKLKSVKHGVVLINDPDNFIKHQSYLFSVCYCYTVIGACPNIKTASWENVIMHLNGVKLFLWSPPPLILVLINSAVTVIREVHYYPAVKTGSPIGKPN